MHRQTTSAEEPARREDASGLCLAAAVLTIILASLTLAGWHFRIAWLKTLPGQITVVVPNSGVMFIACAAAALLLRKRGASPWQRLLADMLAGFVAVFSLLLMIEWTAHVNFGIDAIIFHGRIMQDWHVNDVPGRTSIQASLAFFCSAVGLFLLDKKGGRILSEPFFLVSLLISLLGIVGFIFGASRLYGLMALETTLLFLVLITALLFLRPNEGVMLLVTNPGSGGIAARNLLLKTAVAITLIGWLLVRVRYAAPLSVEFSIALMVVCCIVATAVLILTTSRKLAVVEQERLHAEEAVAESQRRYRELFANSGEGIAIIEPVPGNGASPDDWKFVDVNPSLVGFIGQPREQVLGRTVRELFGAEHVESLLAAANEVYHGGTVHQLELFFPPAQMHFLLSIYPLAGRQFVLTSIDITRSKAAERAMMRTEKLAATARLASTMAHEINNPLEAVTNLIFLAASSVDDPTSGEYLRLASEELGRVAHITKQALAFYRGTSAPASVSIARLMKEVLAVYSRRIETKHLRVEERFEPGAEVTAIAGELRQAFSNLVSNSIDAVGYGGLMVIRARLIVRAGQSGVLVSVADNGAGIPDTIRAQIFEPFFTTKRDFGTGLGLWTTREIILRQGGSIRVRSRTGESRSGTVFCIFLPERATKAGQSPSIAASSAED